MVKQLSPSESVKWVRDFRLGGSIQDMGALFVCPCIVLLRYQLLPIVYVWWELVEKRLMYNVFVCVLSPMTKIIVEHELAIKCSCPCADVHLNCFHHLRWRDVTLYIISFARYLDCLDGIYLCLSAWGKFSIRCTFNWYVHPNIDIKFCLWKCEHKIFHFCITIVYLSNGS